MSMTVDRRLLLRGGVLGFAALSTPGIANVLAARGFTHGVASGEPTANSVLLWTRYVGRDETKLRCEISEDESFAKVISGGEIVASPARDNCAKLIVKGLQPGRHYWYRFIAPNGDKSVVGRTKTLPVGDVAKFNLGVFSCANIGFGWFNAYAHAAARDELDLIVHLGDYLYEYAKGIYPEQAVAGRKVEPANEIVTLTDYRIRYASYRMDPDLQRLHQKFPMIAQWDDHEFANDTYKDGAQNHQPDKEGPWPARKAAAVKAYFEWMPVSEQAAYSTYEIGSLASIFRMETRALYRSKSFNLGQVMKVQADPQAALRDFRDGGWMDPSQTLMGEAQEQWLYRGMKRSAAAGKRWQVLAQQIVMGTVMSPNDMTEYAKKAAGPWWRHTLDAIAATAGTMPFNMDAWDGFPAARERLFKASLEADCNLVVLSGDSHNAWANNLVYKGTPVGVEYAGTSIASPGFEWYLPQANYRDLAKSFQSANPGLMFTDLSRRGYMSIEMTPDQVSGVFHFIDEKTQKNLTPLEDVRLTVQQNQRRLSLV